MSLRLEVSKELYTSGQRTTITVKKKKKEEKSQLLIAVNILLLSFENCICLCDHPLHKICVAMFMEAVYVQICEICTVTST